VALVDRTGASETLSLRPNSYAHPRFSPKGDKLVFWIQQLRCWIKVYDLTRGSMRRIDDCGRNRNGQGFVAAAQFSLKRLQLGDDDLMIDEAPPPLKLTNYAGRYVGIVHGEKPSPKALAKLGLRLESGTQKSAKPHLEAKELLDEPRPQGDRVVDRAVGAFAPSRTNPQRPIGEGHPRIIFRIHPTVVFRPHLKAGIDLRLR